MLPIFNTPLKRLELIKFQKTVNKHITIAVHRNHSFELAASVLNAFLNFSDYDAKFLYSDYDDSLTFKNFKADINIIWIDINKYHYTDIKNFIQEKTKELSIKTQSPILVCLVSNENLSLELPPSCHVINIIDELKNCTFNIFDIEKEPFSGTRLSSQALLEIARMLGMKYIPALLHILIKAVIVDLDNTLYSGILGEDGKDKLIPRNNLQNLLKSLTGTGIMLCACSKNNHSDVLEMFNTRQDFALKFEDFATTQINWNNKAENIINIAKTLNIGLDSILFIDDNPAEIENVSQLPIKTILATNEKDVIQILQNFPGIFKFNITKEDLLRNQDIKANEERLKLLSAVSLEEYFKKLNIHITISINKLETLKRSAELFNKTNQFILTYARFSENDVLHFIEDSDKILITIGMKDKLSDSGIIAIMAAHKNTHVQLEIDELVVSCRALGRNLEHIIIPKIFEIASQQLNCNHEVVINFKQGERNTPALTFLSQLCKQNTVTEFSQLLYNIEKLETHNLSMEIIS